MVGVERVGCFHFNLMGGEGSEFYARYVGEKLGMDRRASDTKGLAGLLNMIRHALTKPSTCKDCPRQHEHVHCPECGSVEHVAETCDMEG